jgi:DNA repair protein RadD
LALLRESLLAGLSRPMLASPTGSGKTGLAAMIVHGALRKGKRVLFVVPTIDLVDQTIEKFEESGIAASDIGAIQADHPRTDWSRPVQVASAQTLQNRPNKPPADVVLIDEAHRWFRFFGKWMAHPDWLKVPFIGLSATPWAKGLGKHYNNLLIVTTTAELIEKKLLSPFRVFAPSHPDLSGVKTVAGDYREDQLGEAMDKPTLIADVVENWLQHGENRPTLCFAVNRAHAKSLQLKFEEAGVRAGYVDGNTPR